jgi:hypothetical protein
LECDAYPAGIPEKILTGELDHSVELTGDGGLHFLPAPDGEVLVKAEDTGLIEHVNQMVDREDVAYKRVQTVLKRKGYRDADFEPGGVLYGWSTNELLELARPKNG